VARVSRDEGRRPDIRPAQLCGELLAALDAVEGRRRRRKRDTTPDAIGIGIKRELLEAALREDPDPDAFEGWLLERCLGAAETYSTGSVRAMAVEVLHEWQLARSLGAFDQWLARGAPSEDQA
jgi:hypothetical protein